MKQPYYYQRNEDYEPEYIGFAESYDDVLNLIDTNEVYENTVIDIMDKDLYLSMKDNIDEDIEELEKYYA